MSVVMLEQPRLFSVTVPEGVVGGQRIEVVAPSGSAFLATVPHGLGPGMEFHVEAPAPKPFATVDVAEVVGHSRQTRGPLYMQVRMLNALSPGSHPLARWIGRAVSCDFDRIGFGGCGRFGGVG